MNKILESLGIHESWIEFFEYVVKQEYFKAILELTETEIVPSKENVFKAFSIPKDKVRILMCFQDPYPDPRFATGIATGVNKGQDRPSLKYIREELNCGYEYFDETMQTWVNQGIMMINAGLTTKPYKSGCHYSVWQPFIRDLIQYLDNGIVFVLFGKIAQGFEKYINNSEIIKAPHPMADHYSDKKVFKGSDVFNKINNKLKNEQINWYSV